MKGNKYQEIKKHAEKIRELIDQIEDNLFFKNVFESIYPPNPERK